MARNSIELLKPHTHAERNYPPGTVLNLADNRISLESAQWLVNLAVAKWVEETPPDSLPINSHEPIDNSEE